MPGEFVTCPDCKGWPSCETGMLCLTCGDDGQVWNEYPDDDHEEWFDEPEKRKVPAPKELRDILAAALERQKAPR